MRENAERAGERADNQARGSAARALLFFGAVVAIAIVSVTGYEIGDLRAAAIEQSRHELEGIDVALAEHVERVIGAADGAILEVARQLGERADGEGSHAGAAAHRLLRAHAAGLPVRAALAYTDAEGRLLAHSAGNPPPAASLAGGEDFRTLRAHPGDLHIGRPLAGEIAPRPLIVLARAIVDPGGRFRGIVTADLDPAYFTKFFGDVVAFDGAAAALFRADGALLAQHSPPGDGAAADWRHVVAGLAPEARSGSVRIVARDGKAHLIGYRRVAGPLLLMLTDMDEDIMLTPWRASTLRLSLTAALGIALVWALVGMILRRMHSEAQQAVRLAQSEEQFRAIVEQASDALLLYDFEGRIVMINQMACTCLGYSDAELVGRDIAVVIIDDPARWRQPVDGQPATREIACRRKDGGVFPAEARLSAFDMGERRLILAMARDISERKAYQARLEQQANFDLLTGLPNRLLFLDRLQTALATARRNTRLLALLFIDLDDFKKINDTLGHAGGDTLLVEVGRRIGGVLREADTAARYGGDEFVVLLPEVESAADAERVADKIQEAFQVPLNLSGRPVPMRLSIGVALYPADGVDADGLLRHADADMYLAKGDGRDGVPPAR